MSPTQNAPRACAAAAVTAAGAEALCQTQWTPGLSVRASFRPSGVRLVAPPHTPVPRLAAPGFVLCAPGIRLARDSLGGRTLAPIICCHPDCCWASPERSQQPRVSMSDAGIAAVEASALGCGWLHPLSRGREDETAGEELCPHPVAPGLVGCVLWKSPLGVGPLANHA